MLAIALSLVTVLLHMDGANLMTVRMYGFDSKLRTVDGMCHCRWRFTVLTIPCGSTLSLYESFLRSKYILFCGACNQVSEIFMLTPCALFSFVYSPVLLANVSTVLVPFLYVYSTPWHALRGVMSVHGRSKALAARSKTGTKA